jgi:hypothetical protein
METRSVRTCAIEVKSITLPAAELNPRAHVRFSSIQEYQKPSERRIRQSVGFTSLAAAPEYYQVILQYQITYRPYSNKLQWLSAMMTMEARACCARGNVLLIN